MTLTAVDDVSFDIYRDEILSLVGESGCGKSTTAKLLCGLYEPSFGSVTVDGIDLATLYNKKESALAKSLRRRKKSQTTHQYDFSRSVRKLKSPLARARHHR